MNCLHPPSRNAEGRVDKRLSAVGVGKRSAFNPTTLSLPRPFNVSTLEREKFMSLRLN